MYEGITCITRLREKERDEKEREMKIHETEGSDTIYTRMMSFG